MATHQLPYRATVTADVRPNQALQPTLRAAELGRWAAEQCTIEMPERLFLIFEHCTAHPVVYLGRAGSPVEALCAYIRQMRPDVQLHPDGSLALCDGPRELRYPHPLAYVEALYKPLGEWQIRELPEAVSHAELTEAFCGEDPSDVASHLGACRQLLRHEVSRFRAPGFLWYLRDGVLATFYRRAGASRIAVLRRYVRRWNGDAGYVPWTGGYSDLMSELYLGPGDPAILRPPR